jgi:hypothetical protein
MFAVLIRTILAGVLGLLLLQMGNWPVDNPEDPLARATTPPNQFLVFNDDFSSLQKDRFMQWINPNRGFVKNGVLLTRDEAAAEFQGERGTGLDTSGVNVHFNFGQFAGANTFQADAWVEYLAREEGEDKVFRFHNMFVFEIIDSIWYLVQSEYVEPDVNVTMQLESGINQAQNVPPELQRFVVPLTSPAQSAISPWPLLIGSNFASGGELHPIEGRKKNGQKWTLAGAVSEGKPTVLYFFAVYSLLVAPKEELDNQMNFLAGLYDTFGLRDLFIFGVTDEPKEKVEWFGASGYDKFAYLLDTGSGIHAALNINAHPYIVVFDATGTVVAVSKTYSPSCYPIIEERIREAVASSSAERHSNESR